MSYCWTLWEFTTGRRVLWLPWSHHVGYCITSGGTKMYSKKLNVTKSQTSSATSRLSSMRALAVADGVDASSVGPGWELPRGSGSLSVSSSPARPPVRCQISPRGRRSGSSVGWPGEILPLEECLFINHFLIWLCQYLSK